MIPAKPVRGVRPRAPRKKELAHEGVRQPLG